MAVVTKSAFARLCGVSRPRVSQWLAAGQIDGAAIVGVGHRARIDADVARAQLRERLDVSQWRPLSRAKLNDMGATIAVRHGDGPSTTATIETEIKAAHLHRIELANAKAEAEARAASGEYLLAADVRREVGAIASSMVAVFDGMLPQFADAVASGSAMPQADVLHLLKSVWRAARERQSALEAGLAVHARETASKAASGRP